MRRRARLLARRLRPSFRRDLEDPSAPLSMDLDGDSGTLLIAFGGMAGELGMPPFEFFKATGGIPVKRLFVRDLHQAWYHRGIPGHGATIEDMAAALGALVAASDVDRLVVAGNSAGGYAALLFGTLLRAEVALCFAPQTVLDLEILGEMGDHRWDDQIRALRSSGYLKERWIDLGNALQPASTGQTSYQVYFDASFAFDRLHVERLAELPGIQLHSREGGEHDVARAMRESGELDRVLQGALS